jgi:hypothetical protein
MGGTALLPPAAESEVRIEASGLVGVSGAEAEAEAEAVESTTDRTEEEGTVRSRELGAAEEDEEAEEAEAEVEVEAVEGAEFDATELSTAESAAKDAPSGLVRGVATAIAAPPLFVDASAELWCG